MSGLTAISPPRHACVGCGGSCQGVRARLVSDAEQARVRDQAASLGVNDPIVDGAIRQVDGRCVFLDDAQRCRIHATFGGGEKPLVCRQYPVVVVDTGGERRIGVDPGCYHAWERGGEPVEVEGLGVHRVPLPPPGEASERAVLAALKRCSSPEEALRALVPGAPDERGLPGGLASRWITRLQAADLAALVGRPDAGPSLRAALAPLADAAPGWSASTPPPAIHWEDPMWPVEVARQVVFLRLQAGFPTPATAAFALLGAVSLAWVDPSAGAVGRGLAAWTRALRAPMFLRAVAADPQTLMRLLAAP